LRESFYFRIEFFQRFLLLRINPYEPICSILIPWVMLAPIKVIPGQDKQFDEIRVVLGTLPGDNLDVSWSWSVIHQRIKCTPFWMYDGAMRHIPFLSSAPQTCCIPLWYAIIGCSGSIVRAP
jgi:hypothetical protein